MAKLKIYGAPQSRAARVIWCANELGLDYDVISIPPSEANGNADLKKLNPNGKIPAIDDDGTVLFESMAINMYLAAKYGNKSGLWPADEGKRGQCGQWSHWVMSETETPLLTILLNKLKLRPEGQNPSDQEAATSREKLVAPLKVLDGYLQGKDYLVGNAFSIADLNVASVLNWTGLCGIDLAPYPNLQRWLKACNDRPSTKKKAA